MPVYGQVAPTHVGALKHAAIYEELCARDVAAGYVSTGFEFPDVWPCVVDPTNVVMQNGKGRMTIDKTMHISGDPELPSYNLAIVLEVDEEGKRYKIVRVWQLARAGAIFDAVTRPLTDVETMFVKLDLEAFFRKHGKQRAHVWQSGRLTSDGYGTDWRVNFGERDAPDHTGRSSNATCHFMRHEMKRLEAEYPTVVPELDAWLERRRQLRPAWLSPQDDFCFAVLFWVCFYVDDAGAAIVNDLLYRRDGSPLVELVTRDDGTTERVHRRRAHVYFDAMIGVAEYMGHGVPMRKRVYPLRIMDFLGIGLDLNAAIRYLCKDKERRYLAQLHELVETARPLRGQPRRVRRGEFNTLVHRLLHASEVVPLGRSHLFHCLRALRDVNRLDGDDLILGDAVLNELGWWAAAMLNARQHAVPLASRSSFPCSTEPDTLTHYGDASREVDEETQAVAHSSGYGSWTVIEEIFYFIEGRWEAHECTSYSINLLELAVELFGAAAFVAQARSSGVDISHVHTFVDNTCAEHISERGRTQSEGLNQLNQRRQEWLVAAGVHQRTSRVASVFNDIADLLSRGDIDGALRFPQDAGLRCVRVEVPAHVRKLESIAATWA